MQIEHTRFCLNRMISPGLDLEGFFTLTRDVGLRHVELRNDLPGEKILDDLSPEQVKSLADTHGIRILTINAIQQFNLGTVLDQVYAEVNEMLAMASAIGCYGIVLCPNNDTADTRTPEQFYHDTVTALQKFAPLFQEAGIIGLIEPFGFEGCSLRSKEIVIQAIRESGYDGYNVLHDTFHHYLGPDEIVYPSETGLVHISGVETDIPTAEIRDEYRLLIGVRDIMDNKGQIQALESQGYTGCYSFEPFSAEVQKMSPDALKDALNESLDFITAM